MEFEHLKKKNQVVTQVTTLQGTPVVGTIRTPGANILERVMWTLAEALAGSASAWAAKYHLGIDIDPTVLFTFFTGSYALIKNLIVTKMEQRKVKPAA